MEQLLGRAMDQGYLGMSTDGLPFTWPMPPTPTSASHPVRQFGEMKRLPQVVRDRAGCGGRPRPSWKTGPRRFSSLPADQRPPVR